MGIITSTDIIRISQKKMKFYIAFAVILLLGIVAAEESKPEAAKEDVLSLDYHVCTRGHLIKIIHRLRHLRNHCYRRTRIARKRCNNHIRWYTHHIRHLRKVYRHTIHQIRIYKHRYHVCRKRCYWSCKRIIHYWSRRRGDNEE